MKQSEYNKALSAKQATKSHCKDGLNCKVSNNFHRDRCRHCLLTFTYEQEESGRGGKCDE